MRYNNKPNTFKGNPYVSDEKRVTIKCPTLHPWQLTTIKAYNRFHKNTFITVLSPRQSGKSYTIKVMAMMASINYKNYKVIIVSPTFALAKKMFKELKKILKQIPGIVTTANASDFIIELANGSTIEFKSAEQGDALRGFTANLLLVDEAAFIPLETATACLWPYTNTTRGSIVMFSTPTVKSDDNLFSKYYHLGIKKNNPRFISIDWSKYDLSAMLDPETKQMYKETLPAKVYLNEIEGKFLDMQSSVFGEYGKVLSNDFNRKENEFWVAVDWGAGGGNDDTAIVVMNGLKQMVRLRYFNDLNTLEGVKEVVDIIKQYRPKAITVEINSLGQPNYDLLRAELNKAGIRTSITKFVTTNESKRKIIESLALAIEKQEVQLLNEPKLSLEFATYELESTKTGKITYNASTGNHDDIVMATAICLDSMTKSQYKIR